MRNMMTFGAVGTLFVLGACASNTAPVEEATPVTPPEREVEAPVEVVRDDVRTVETQTYTGPVRGSIEDFVVNVGDRVYFDLDQYTLDATDRQTLDLQAAWLQSYPNVTVLIAGNADERGTREYNLALGARRANSVRAYLESQGVDPSRIETTSYGKERPIDPRSTEEAWSVNRNGHTQITSGAASSTTGG